MKQSVIPRRQFLKLGCATMAVFPLAMAVGPSHAAQNASVRASLKYQNKPEGDKSCANCSLFVPGADAKAPGTCKVIPGDNEIAPNAYCIAWAKKG